MFIFLLLVEITFSCELQTWLWIMILIAHRKFRNKSLECVNLGEYSALEMILVNVYPFWDSYLRKDSFTAENYSLLSLLLFFYCIVIIINIIAVIIIMNNIMVISFIYKIIYLFIVFVYLRTHFHRYFCQVQLVRCLLKLKVI